MTPEEMKKAMKKEKEKEKKNKHSFSKSFKKSKHQSDGVSLAEYEGLKAKFESINTMNKRYESRVGRIRGAGG